MPRYIIVVLRDINQIVYAGYDHARAHKTACEFLERRPKKLYDEIPGWLRHSYQGRDPADYWEFSRRGNVTGETGG